MDIFGIFQIVPVWLLLLVVSVILYRLYMKQKFLYFTKRGINGPTPSFLFGNMRQMSEKGNILQTLEWTQKYGKVYGFFVSTRPRYIISDLEILKEVFVKDFQHFSDRETLLSGEVVRRGVFFQNGQDWKRLRNIITPTFSSGKLKLMLPSIIKCGGKLAENLKVQAKNGGSVDVKRFYGAYTMDVIATTAFGLDIDSQTNPDEPFVQNARKLFEPSPSVSILVMLGIIFPFVRTLLTIMDIGFFPKSAVNFFVASIKQMVSERKNDVDSKLRSDFLQLLLDAESEEDGNDDAKTNKSVKRLSSEEVIGQAFLFFIAGYETTATAMQYVSYILATKPEIQEKVRDEMNTKLGDKELTYEDLNKLTYLEQVIQETLRMYPPVPMINRKATDDVNVKGIQMPKGMVVGIPIYTVHHDPDVFENPEEFIPERFANRDFNPISFLPFGFGPRICIGLRLAMIEAKVAIVSSLRTVKFTKHELTPEKIEFTNAGTLISKTKIIVGAELID